MKTMFTCQEAVLKAHARRAYSVIFDCMLLDRPYRAREVAEMLRQHYLPFARLARRTLHDYTRAILAWMQENCIDGETGESDLIREGYFYIAPSRGAK